MKIHYTLTALLGALLVFTFPATGAEITACVQDSNGKLRIVGDAGDCKNGESVLVWNQQGPEGPAGPPGEQGPPGEPAEGGAGLTMVDANGLPLGQIVNSLGPHFSGLVARVGDYNVLLYALTVSGSHYLDGSRGGTYHEANDCLGPQLAQAFNFIPASQQFVLDTTVGLPGRSLYVLDHEGLGQTLTVRSQSWYDINAETWRCQDFGGGFTRNGLHELTDPVADLDQFVSPFSMEGVSEIPVLGQ